MGLLDLFRRLDAPVEERQTYPYTIDQWVMQYMGGIYPLSGMNQTIKGNQESIPNNFAGLVQGAYQRNGVVFACELVRMSLFSEARFQFQAMRNGRPGDLYGTPALQPLERPWDNASTSDLLTKSLLDADFAGNAFSVRRGDKLKRLRPDWVTLVLTGENGDPDTEMLGIIFQPGGPGSGRDPMTFLAAEVSHFAPIPDPLASYRGMSWLTPIIREVQADSAATLHKESSFTNGATPNMIVKLDVTSMEKFEAYKKMFRDNHEGATNAYKTLFLAGGADATVVGQNFQQMTFKELQGSAETRIAAAAGVHPAIVGLSEGLQGSSLNAGNFTAAARLTGDKTLRPLWRNFCGSIEHLIDVPGGSRLWYDDRDIAFLQADVKDAAEVQQIQAASMKSLIDAGYEPDSIIAAITSQDWAKLQHTGLFSVQLQPPMPEGPPAPVLPAPASNGNGKTDANQQLAFASIIAGALERRAPDVIRIEPQVQPTPVELHVEAPNVEVHPPTVDVHPPDIHVEAPEVRVEPPSVTVASPDVTVNVDTPPAPVVNVTVPEPKKTRRKVIRDENERIVGVEDA